METDQRSILMDIWRIVEGKWRNLLSKPERRVTAEGVAFDGD